jgi:hypothetical protein
VEFCNPFDEALAHGGPAGVFLYDRRGMLRFDDMRTRDAWGRAPGPHAHRWTWLLMRDHGTHFVSLVLVTSPTLVQAHPRADLRVFDALEDAVAARAAFGEPPLCSEPW